MLIKTAIFFFKCFFTALSPLSLKGLVTFRVNSLYSPLLKPLRTKNCQLKKLSLLVPYILGSLTEEKKKKRDEIWHTEIKNYNTKTLKDLKIGIFSSGRAIKRCFQTLKCTNYTPLHVAAYYGNFKLFHEIYVKAKDKYPKDENGGTPFHVAADNGNMEICQFLIAKYGNYNPKSKTGNTPLHGAAENGHFDVFKIIIETVEGKNPENKFGWTPLHIAAEKGHFEIFKLSFLHAKDKNPEDIYGQTPLHLASIFRNLEVCKFVLENIKDGSPEELKRLKSLSDRLISFRNLVL